MGSKTPQRTQTKDELRRMLAQAVLNTPGASQLQPIQEAPPPGRKLMTPSANPARIAKPERGARSAKRKSRTKRQR